MTTNQTSAAEFPQVPDEWAELSLAMARQMRLIETTWPTETDPARARYLRQFLKYRIDEMARLESDYLDFVADCIRLAEIGRAHV